MADDLDDEIPFEQENAQDVLREWARKTYLRSSMRVETLSPGELSTLDDRLARWQADRQMTGILPPDYELRARYPAFEKELRGGRDKARPILSPDEIRDVDTSRAAVSVRDAIDKQGHFAPALRQASAGYSLSAGMSELDARKAISDRFATLFDRTITEYAEHRQAARLLEGGPHAKDRLFPAELHWDRYEPAFRRLAAYDSKLHIGRVNGELSEKEYQEGQSYRKAWMFVQRRQGRLPSIAEMGLPGLPVDEMLLPYKKQWGRQERARMQGADGAYWRQVDELAGYLKEDIKTDRRYARNLETYALDSAARYGRRVEQMKADIEERFTLHYLYTPGEYLERRLATEKSREAQKERDKDGGREL